MGRTKKSNKRRSKPRIERNDVQDDRIPFRRRPIPRAVLVICNDILLRSEYLYKHVPRFLPILVLVLVALDATNAQGLKLGFYKKTCPNVETIVRKTTASFFSQNSTLAAALLRMNFHDCFFKLSKTNSQSSVGESSQQGAKGKAQAESSPTM
ncbi:peroxidase 62-like [Papaver somniferum]|uniref:peroxidase 62-like n=1 Tax=Papaver somniferum TaxID=3469 RepID=UPI000E6FD638|nr:peroxidase 62-like [Papaver somniferum]